MTDRCETCGWWQPPSPQAKGGPYEKFGSCRRRSGLDGNTEYMGERAEDWCGEHTAVQRRRDRLMLAGQALGGLCVQQYGLADREGVLHEYMAKQALDYADAVLTKAEEGS